MIFAAADIDPIFLFVLALVGLICGVIAAFQSGWRAIIAWGLIAIAGAGVLAWWP